jgi:hypothetical protein
VRTDKQRSKNGVSPLTDNEIVQTESAGRLISKEVKPYQSERAGRGRREDIERRDSWVELGVNYKQIPVHQPKVPLHSYSKDGLMRVQNVSDPVHYPQVEVWESSGEFVHAAYTKRKDDDDFGQAGILVRKVMDDAARDRLVSNVIGHLQKGVTEPVLGQRFDGLNHIRLLRRVYMTKCG